MLTGILLFAAGCLCGCAACVFAALAAFIAARPRVKPPAREEKARTDRERRELMNFFTYDGSPQTGGTVKH